MHSPGSPSIVVADAAPAAEDTIAMPINATLRAIRSGEVDAVVVESERGPQVYTLDGAEFDYRALIESMNEGALVLKNVLVTTLSRASCVAS